jgi:spore coat polysaccharide biosynthesis protein SpsF
MNHALAPRTTAIVQARLSSSRLPGKALMPLNGLPMILFMLERVKRARLIDEIVMATSTDRSDDELAAVVAAAGFRVHRGPLDDVLARFAGAVQGHPADWIVRLTGDCPLIDPQVVDHVIMLAQVQRHDYANNVESPSYPDGLDVEVFTRAALLQAAAEARLPSEREHVTPFIRNRPEQFKLGELRCPVDLSALRWTVDHPDDLELVRALVAAVVARGDDPLRVDLFDLVRVVDTRPELMSINPHERNEGYLKSLLADARLHT